MREPSEKCSKTGRLFAFKMRRSTRRMERDGRPVVKFDAMVSASVKNHLVLQKSMCHLYCFEYNYVKTAFNVKDMVFWIPLKFLPVYREIRTTCSVNTLSIGRQLRKFPSEKYFWMGKVFRKSILRMK